MLQWVNTSTLSLKLLALVMLLSLARPSHFADLALEQYCLFKSEGVVFLSSTLEGLKFNDYCFANFVVDVVCWCSHGTTPLRKGITQLFLSLIIQLPHAPLFSLRGLATKGCLPTSTSSTLSSILDIADL